MDGKLLWDAIDVEHSQLASGDDISPQRRPEKRPHKLFEAREDRDLGQVRPDGSDELSKVCCVEVVERGDEREGSGVDPQRAHRLGVRASPGDDPRGADGRLATKQKARARFLRCRDLFFKVEPEKLVERRRVARAVEVAEGLANKRDSQTSPDKVTFRIHDQDRHEHLVGTSMSFSGTGAPVELELELLLAPPGALSRSRSSFSAKRSLKSATAADPFRCFRERLLLLLPCCRFADGKLRVFSVDRGCEKSERGRETWRKKRRKTLLVSIKSERK
jgi:hypothetical protein